MLGSAVSVRVCVDHIGHSCEAEMLPICGVYKNDLHLLLDQVPSVIIQSITRLFQRFVFEKLKECLNEKGPRDPLYFLTDKKLKGYQRRLEEVSLSLKMRENSEMGKLEKFFFSYYDSRAGIVASSMGQERSVTR